MKNFFWEISFLLWTYEQKPLLSKNIFFLAKSFIIDVIVINTVSTTVSFITARAHMLKKKKLALTSLIFFILEDIVKESLVLKWLILEILAFIAKVNLKIKFICQNYGFFLVLDFLLINSIWQAWSYNLNNSSISGGISLVVINVLDSFSAYGDKVKMKLHNWILYIYWTEVEC